MKRISSARRRAYRSRHRQSIGWNGKFLIVFAVCAFALFILAILLGNYLGRTAGGILPIPGENASSGQQTSGASGPRPAPQNLTAGPERLAETGSTEDSRPSSSDDVTEQTGVTYNAASVLLRAPAPEDGAETGTETSGSTGIHAGTGMKLYYTSQVAKMHGYDLSDSTELIPAVNRLKKLPGREKVCGIFCLLFPTSQHSIKQVMREYEKALIVELAEAGVDDILLVGFDGASLAEAGSFVSELAEATGGVCSFGIAFDFDFYAEAGTELRRLIKTMSSGGMYFALDLSGETVPGLMTPESLVHDRVDRLSSFLLTYGIRVVVGCGPESGFDGEAAAAVKAGAVSVQVRPRAY